MAQSLRIPSKLPVTVTARAAVWRQQIVSGQGLALIQARGWTHFRSALSRVGYSEIMKHQLAQITQTAPDLSSSAIKNDNVCARERTAVLSEELKRSFPKAGNGAFYFHPDNELAYKLNIIGRERSESEGHTKIYITVPTRHAPEIFQGLLNSLAGSQVMRFLTLTLYAQAAYYEDVDEPVTSQANTIIIYADQLIPGIMRKTCQAIAQAKTSNEPLWALSAAERSQVTRSHLYYFMVPLDDNTAFVEMDKNRSYHLVVWPDLAKQICGGRLRITLEDLVDKTSKWSPENPGKFIHPDMLRRFYHPELSARDPNPLQHRRKYQPALIFDHH